MRLVQSISALKNARFGPRIIFVGTLIHLLVTSALSNPFSIPSPADEAVDYRNTSDIVWGINQLLSLLLPIVFLVVGRDTRVASRLSKYGKYLTLIVVASIFATLNWLIQSPLMRIGDTAYNQSENISTPPVSHWILSHFLESLPAIIFSILAALFVFWLINKSPTKWWIWATGVFSFLFLVFLIVEPLTISHKPLGQTPVEIKIAELAETIGIPKDSIVLEDCEPFGRCEIAHVSGLGPTRLILLNKELPATYPESWTIQSFAHESKHFIKDDNLTGWLVLTLILLLFFWLTDVISRTIIQRSSGSLGFTSIRQPAALPLMILILNAMLLIALPPINIFRQQVEFEADRFGLELTHAYVPFAEMVSSWTVESKRHVPDPGLFFMLFRSSHPSDATRINFANESQLKAH